MRKVTVWCGLVSLQWNSKEGWWSCCLYHLIDRLNLPNVTVQPMRTSKLSAGSAQQLSACRCCKGRKRSARRVSSYRLRRNQPFCGQHRVSVTVSETSAANSRSVRFVSPRFCWYEQRWRKMGSFSPSLRMTFIYWSQKNPQLFFFFLKSKYHSQDSRHLAFCERSWPSDKCSIVL